MITSDLFSVSNASKPLDAGKVTPFELTERAIEATERYQPHVNAYMKRNDRCRRSHGVGRLFGKMDSVSDYAFRVKYSSGKASSTLMPRERKYSFAVSILSILSRCSGLCASTPTIASM